jgi:hypothetical protein
MFPYHTRILFFCLAAFATSCRTVDDGEIQVDADTGSSLEQDPDGERPHRDEDSGTDTDHGHDTGQDEDTSDEDNAVVEWVNLPTGLACGETYVAEVKMRNTGQSTWTRDGGFKLGAVNDDDSLYGPDVRVWLSEGVSVRPGETHIFDFLLAAPQAESVYLTDWQMVHEAVRWFGDTAAQAVTVYCITEQTFCDPLTRPGQEAGFSDKNVRGGSFSAAGWQTTGGNDQLVLAMAAPLSGSATLEIDVTNFDPASQYAGPKHQIINMYTSDNGSRDVFESNEAWWNIRTGTNYGSGFKLLAAPNGGDTRDEARLIPNASWNPADTHTFTVEWDASYIDLYLDGTHLETLPFQGRVQPLQHIFIGTDNVYDGQVGPIYSNLCVTQRP